MSEEQTEEPTATLATQERPEAQEAPAPARREPAAPAPAADGNGAAHPAPAATAAPTPPPASREPAAPAVPAPIRDDVDFVDFMASMGTAGGSLNPLKEGEVVKGTVVHIDREGVLVDVG